MHTLLTRALGIELPIIQAPMAGANATPPALVAAVSNAGGLGCIGAAYMSPDEITEQAAAVRRLTSRPFGINLFAPFDPVAANDGGGRVSAADPGAAIQRLRGYHEELGLPAPTAPSPPRARFDEQFEAVMRSGARVFSFTFNALASEHIAAARSRGLYVMGTATTVDEARALVENGVDAVVAQGSEAGGHRGTFAAPFEMAMIGTMALVPQVVDAVPVPVVASGGIMDGRGIAAALALGASAAQMGTAFLVCDECGVVPAYKDLITRTTAESTRLTRAFSGRPARGIVNRVMLEIESDAGAGAILPYPDQNTLTRPMRSAATARGQTEYLSLWAGQGAPLARQQSANALMQRLASELNVARQALLANS